MVCKSELVFYCNGNGGDNVRTINYDTSTFETTENSNQSLMGKLIRDGKSKS